MPDRTTVLAVVGLAVVLVTGPTVAQAGTYQYTVEVSEELTNQREWASLSNETRSLIEEAREVDGPVTVAPSGYDAENATGVRLTYPESLEEEPHPEVDAEGPYSTAFVAVDDGRYVVFRAEASDTRSLGGPSYTIDVTAADRTDAVVLRRAELSAEARAVIDRARATGEEVEVHADPPPEFADGYDPPEGVVGALFGRTDEFVVVDGETRYAVRVDVRGDVLGFSGPLTAAFVLGALLTVPALVSGLRRSTGPVVAAAVGVAAVVVAVAVVRIVARPPPLGHPLKWLQAREQLPVVALSALAAVVVVGVEFAFSAPGNDDGRDTDHGDDRGRDTDAGEDGPGGG